MRENAVETQHTAHLHWEPLLYPLTFAVALILRILQLGVFTTQGELAWTFRAFKFWQALGERSLGAGAEADPGGSVTLAISSLGFALRRLLEDSGTSVGWQELATLTTFDAQNLAQVRQVAFFWPSAKLPIAVLNAALVVLLAFLVARLWGARAGLFAGLLLAVAPYHLALSRVIGPDAPTAGLAVGALLALLWALQDPRSWGRFLLSGALGGLAVLNQNAVALLLPYGLLLLVATHLGQRRRTLLALRNIGLWLGAALVGATFAYAATWTSPLLAAQAVLRHLGQGLGLVGRSLASPAGPLDLLALGLRLTPLAIVGLAMAIIALPWEENSRRLPGLGLLGFAAAFLLLIPWRDHAGHRALTAVVALEAVAALGLDGLPAALQRLLRLRSRQPSLWPGLALSAALLAAIGWQALAVVRYHPHHPAYRNPWLAARAPLQASAGWGEGMDRVAEYLNAQPRASKAYVATLDLPSLAPFFLGQTVPLTEDSLATADYVVVYNRDWLWPDPFLARLPAPQQVVYLHGTEYARIYANQGDAAVLAVLEGEVRPEDVIILDAPSPFARHYQGQATFEQIRVETPAQVAEELTALASGRWRLWHVAFDGADPQQIGRQLLETQALLVQRHEAPGVVISSYLLPLQTQFRPIVPTRQMGLELPGGLRLERAGLAESHVQYRQSIGLAIDWRTRAKPAANLAISLRLIDAQGRQWAHQDHWVADAQGRFTASWGSDQSVLARYTLPVPPAIPPGSYHLRLIAYLVDSPATPVPDAAAHVRSEVDFPPFQVLPPQIPPTVAELRLTHPLQVTVANGLELLGSEIWVEDVEAGKELPLKLWWRATSPMTMTYQAHLMLVDAKGDQRGDCVVELANPDYPTPAWAQGEVIEGRYDLEVDVGAASGEAIVGVEIVTPRGSGGEPVRVGTVQVKAIEFVFQPPTMQSRRRETLDQKVRLLGYDLEPTAARPGEVLSLTLYWQALAPMQTSYTVFTHLLDAGGQMRAGHDGIPVSGTRPTNKWLLHEVLTDRHEIPVPADARPGRYQVEVGLYDAATWARLPAYDAAGQRLQHDRILLGTVTIE